MKGPEQRTVDVDVQDVETRGKTVVGYAAVYGAEARIGDTTERIAAGAFAPVLSTNPDVRALLNHDANIVLGRTKSGTLRLSDDPQGLRFELDLPESRGDLREAVARGDLDGASFRFVVGDEQWDGDRRTITRVAELHDVTLATYPAYPAASIELRTRTNPATGQEEITMADQAPQDTDTTVENTEDRAAPVTGGLQVTDRVTARAETRTRGLADEFRSRGFPAEVAVMPWAEYEARAITWTGSVNNITPTRREGVNLGHDARYLFTALETVGVDAGVTSVDVVQQTARSLASTTTMNRPIDSTAVKPETGSTIAITTMAMRQVASKQSAIPNIYLESPVVNRIIEQDLRLALAEALDAMAVAAVAGSPFTAPGTNPLLVSIRQAISALQADGYAPNVLVLRPADAEALDTLTTATAGDYVFGAGSFAPGTLFGLERRISKAAAAPIVMDSSSFGRLYSSPVSLARFEESAGATNSSLIRLECNAVIGVERANAARRIAAA